MASTSDREIVRQKILRLLRAFGGNLREECLWEGLHSLKLPSVDDVIALGMEVINELREQRLVAGWHNDSDLDNCVWGYKALVSLDALPIVEFEWARSDTHVPEERLRAARRIGV